MVPFGISYIYLYAHIFIHMYMGYTSIMGFPLEGFLKTDSIERFPYPPIAFKQARAEATGLDCRGVG